MSIVKTKNLTYEYLRRDEDGNVEGAVKAVNDVSLRVHRGDFIAIVGHNGSGKSTLAKHLNAILQPTQGTVWVDGIDTRQEERVWEIRQRAGMVFQNPDNQIIGQIVEEDVGFGPENLGVPTQEIWKRVEESLQAVGMYQYRTHSPNKLSGGQKQRVSIAGVLAMHPECIILDEPTAMLDPGGRKEVIHAVRELNRTDKVTVILITHYMEEIIHADHVYVMDQGQIAMEGTPREIFSQVERLKELRLDVPQVTLLAYELQQRGLKLPNGILTTQELVKALRRYEWPSAAEPMKETQGATAEEPRRDTQGNPAEEPLQEAQDSPAEELSEERTQEEKARADVLVVDHVSYVYDPDAPLARMALDDVSLTIPEGQFIGVIGHTGSGKSTLMQHLNGLARATSGRIYFNGQDIDAKDYNKKELRSKVGLVFQYPEHQLFEVDVFSDVCFGPRNLGLDKAEVERRAAEALERVGIPRELYTQSPFELSGGQKRRVAIAGVLAMDPEILILDEPTAGLDPRGRREILDQIKDLQTRTHITILLVSHSMEDVAEYVDRIIVMNRGKIIYDDTPQKIFRRYRELEEIGLGAPQVTYIMQTLRKNGLPVNVEVTTAWQAADEIKKVLDGALVC